MLAVDTRVQGVSTSISVGAYFPVSASSKVHHAACKARCMTQHLCLPTRSSMRSEVASSLLPMPARSIHSRCSNRRRAYSKLVHFSLGTLRFSRPFICYSPASVFFDSNRSSLQRKSGLEPPQRRLQNRKVKSRGSFVARLVAYRGMDRLAWWVLCHQIIRLKVWKLRLPTNKLRSFP